MGTNYYFRPKGFTEIDRLNKNLKDSVSVLKEEYLNKLKELLVKTESQYKDYADLLYLTDISDLEDRVEFTVSEFEVPDIHICKISAGWIPLFESNRFYSNFRELEKFYLKYKDNLVFVNEYDDIINFEKFKKDVFDRIDNKNYQTHLQYNNSYGIRYYKDEFGVEWTNTQFS